MPRFLSAKGREILDALAALNLQMAENLIRDESRDMEATHQTMRRLERRWTDAIRSEAPAEEPEF